MDPFFTFVEKHADYRKLVQAVQRVLELVNQAVDTPASCVDQESVFNREVSPDLDANAGLAVAQYASSSVGIGHQEQDKFSPSVRAILNNFGNGSTTSEEEEYGSDEDEDDGIQIESSTAVNVTSSASVRHRIAKSSTEEPAKPVKVDSVFEIYKDVWGDRTCDVDPSGHPPDWEKGYCCNWLRYKDFNRDKTKAWAHSILGCSSCILRCHMWSEDNTIYAKERGAFLLFCKDLIVANICLHLTGMETRGINGRELYDIHLKELDSEPYATYFNEVNDYFFTHHLMRHYDDTLKVMKKTYYKDRALTNALPYINGKHNKKVNWPAYQSKLCNVKPDGSQRGGKHLGCTFDDPDENNLKTIKAMKAETPMPNFLYFYQRETLLTLGYGWHLAHFPYDDDDGDEPEIYNGITNEGNENDEVKDSFFSRKNVATKSSSTSTKSSLVQKPKKSGTSSKRKIAKSSLEPNSIDRREKAETDRQLELIPKEVKGDFNKVGFALFEGKYLPAIQISPFEISQFPIRNEGK